jgi:signal peptidase I
VTDLQPPPTLEGGADTEERPAGDEERKRGRAVLEWGILLVAAVVIAFIIKTLLFQAFYIPSESMVPTLEKGDRVLVNKLSYRLHDPHRGDIVVFSAPESAKSDGIDDLVKRIVGLPGETIEGRGGHIYINGKRLAEPYLHDVQSRTFGPEHVPADSYFMLGDNRPYSKDSTFFGPIKRSKIVGRVFVRIWPPSRLGFL